MMTRSSLHCAFALILLGSALGCPLRAQQPTGAPWQSAPAVSAQAATVSPIAAEKPNLMVSVETRGKQAQDVILTYNLPVTPEQVRLDVAALQRSTGWAVAGLTLSSFADPYGQAHGKLLSAEFSTVSAIEPGSGKLPVAPIVNAFRRYQRLLLLFDMETPFTYTGHTSYQDSAVTIQMRPQTSPDIYAFDVLLNGNGAGSLQLPAEMGTSTSRGHSLSLAMRLLMALLLSTAVGIAAYNILLRMTLRAESSAGS